MKLKKNGKKCGPGQKDYFTACLIPFKITAIEVFCVIKDVPLSVLLTNFLSLFISLIYFHSNSLFHCPFSLYLLNLDMFCILLCFMENSSLFLGDLTYLFPGRFLLVCGGGGEEGGAQDHRRRAAGRHFCRSECWKFRSRPRKISFVERSKWNINLLL